MSCHAPLERQKGLGWPCEELLNHLLSLLNRITSMFFLLFFVPFSPSYILHYSFSRPFWIHSPLCLSLFIFFVPGLVYVRKVKLTQFAIRKHQSLFHISPITISSLLFLNGVQCRWPAIAVASRASPGIALHSYFECRAATLLPPPHPDVRMWLLHQSKPGHPGGQTALISGALHRWRPAARHLHLILQRPHASQWRLDFGR